MSAKLRKEVLALIKEEPLTLKELVTLTGTSNKKIFRIIRKLFEKGTIDSIYVPDGDSKYKAI